MAGKDVVGGAGLLPLLDNHHRSSGERNPMFSPSLHPNCRDSPNPCGEVHLRPVRAQALARSGCGEDGKLQGQCCNAIGLPQARRECRHLLIGHCREMLPGEFLTSREKAVEVTAPPGRIFSEHRPLARAASRTRSIRPRSREAVSGILCQIGLNTPSTSTVPMVLTGMERIAPVYTVIVIFHCAGASGSSTGSTCLPGTRPRTHRMLGRTTRSGGLR